MLGLDLTVKSGMLKSGNTATLAAGPSTTYAQSVQKRLPIPDFEREAKASTSKDGKKRPAMVRKMKSFMSTKEPTELPDGFLLVHAPSKPSSPIMDGEEKKLDATKLQTAAAQAHMLKTKTL